MEIRKDETGKRYGRLTVLSAHDSLGYQGVNWLCKCDCGNEKIVPGYQLRRGRVLSCGCLKTTRFLLQEKEKVDKEYKDWVVTQASYNPRKFELKTYIKKIINTYRIYAEKRGYIWALSYDEVETISILPCHYCGTINSNSKRLSNGQTFLYNGIDRKDNSKGYTIDNVLPCCFRCNRAKYTSSYEDYIAWIDNLVLYRLNSTE